MTRAPSIPGHWRRNHGRALWHFVPDDTGTVLCRAGIVRNAERCMDDWPRGQRCGRCEDARDNRARFPAGEPRQ